MKTGLYKKSGCYLKGDDYSKAFNKLEVEKQVQAEIAQATNDGRQYRQQRYYLLLPDEKLAPNVQYFELGFLVTVAKEEAEWRELVAVEDMPPAVGGRIEIAFQAPQTIPLDGMEAMSPYAAPVEIRTFRMRYWGPEFLKIMAWERDSL